MVLIASKEEILSHFLHRESQRSVSGRSKVVTAYQVHGMSPAICGHCLMKLFTSSYFTMRPISLCTQLSYSDWYQQLGGEAVADAILGRIIPSSYKLEMQGQVSMRQRLAE